MRSRDQVRAARAYQAMREARSDEVRGLGSDLPALLRTNGLLATVAFLISKGKEPHRRMLDLLLSHLRQELPDLQMGNDAKEVFLGWVEDPVGGPELRRLSAEALAYAGWLKRASEAYGAGE